MGWIRSRSSRSSGARIVAAGMWLSLWSVAPGCSSDGAQEATSCVPGEAASCRCADGSAGVQVCLGANVGYGACRCATVDSSVVEAGGDGSAVVPDADGSSKPPADGGLVPPGDATVPPDASDASVRPDATDAKAPLDAADATATVDAADAASGGGNITCGSATCKASTEDCCVVTFGGSSCVTKGKCTSGFVFNCSDSRSCAVGEVCCGEKTLYGAGSSRCATACPSSTGVVLCYTDAECTAPQKCLAVLGNPYKICK